MLHGPVRKALTFQVALQQHMTQFGVCRLVRNILADKPRVTRFPIDFDAVSAAPAAKPTDATTAAATLMEA